MTTSHRRRPSRNVLAALLAALVALGAVLVVFQPQKLFYDKTVDESLPAPAPEAASAPLTATPSPALSTSSPASSTSAPVRGFGSALATTSRPAGTSPAAGPTVLGTGAFTGREHRTTGSATVLRLVDGTRVLRLERLDTSNGPDLHVYLTTASADAPDGALGRHSVSLGTLKGNKGNQNYVLPRSLALAPYRSVVIWCKRFSVPFGVAPLSR